MFKYFILILFFPYYSEGRGYCEIFEIKQDLKYKNCTDKQTVFAYLNYFHNEPNIKYEFNLTYQVKIPTIYKRLILNFLEQNCYIKKKIRIKEITNYDDNINYKTKIIVSCIYKS